MIYDIIYALMAQEGREAALFGDGAPLAHEAFERSLVGAAFPELWFELPLAGDPWFDLHVLTAREDVSPNMTFAPDSFGGCGDAFAWFAQQERGVRQLALSYDVSSGDIAHPAVQLLVGTDDPECHAGFLTAAGRPDAAEAYRRFAARLPRGWFACYAGVFPRRPEVDLRVECIPDARLQQAYAADSSLLKADLAQLGMEEFGDTLLPRCQELAQQPFELEFQFDVTRAGAAGSTFAASLRFGAPSEASSGSSFDPKGAAGELMKLLESWGLADERWRLLAGTMFAKRMARQGRQGLLYAYPAFIKLRWRNGKPVDAKTYLIAGVQQIASRSSER